MSLLHQSRRLWQRHVLAENRRSIEGLLDTLCADPIYKVMATNATFRGKAAVAEFYTSLFAAVPDVVFDLINVFISEDGVVEESIMKGSHLGTLFGVPATRREIALPLTIIFPMLNGEILGERLYFDAATLARQLGVSVDRLK